MANQLHTLERGDQLNAPLAALSRFVPSVNWLRSYNPRQLSSDLIAGLIVAVMLVPQGMAYALLAGLPPQAGLYASILPLVIYGLLGTSRVLAVGPAAMISLLVASGIAPFAETGTVLYLQYAITLALMVAVMQMALGVLRAGFLVNFLSHPVLVGFTGAAAVIIGVGQLRHVLGVSVPRAEHPHETLLLLTEQLPNVNPLALVVGLGSIGVLLFYKYALPGLLQKTRLPEGVAVPLARSGPLVVVVVGILAVRLFSLDIAVVGMVPAGLPPITVPSLDPAIWRNLFPIALTISLVGYTESIAIARSLAAKKRQKIDPNQELIALGAANIGAAFSGAFPVTGGLSRSAVNEAAGAVTGLASIVTAGLVALTVVFLTPLFTSLPNAVLASIILVAVLGLFDFAAFRDAWAYSRSEGAAVVITFVAVLVLGIETGVIVGAVAALSFHLWRTSRPHIAVVGRIADTEHYRNIHRHEVETNATVVGVRVDESLYFPNAQHLEDELFGIVADRPNIRHLVLICSPVNAIDTSALHTLENLLDELRASGVDLHLAEVKGPVMDRLQHTHFMEKLGADHIYLSAHQAMTSLAEKTDSES